MTNGLIQNGNYFQLIEYNQDKRVSFRLSETSDSELIPQYPELVDIKLTDVCHIGCPWCYQDSTSHGLHGELETIKTVIRSLPTFTEVAFGGGDVLQHPDIVEILQFARERGLTSSNITMNWQSVMRYPKQVQAVMPYLDAIGVSITGRGQIPQVIDQLKRLNVYQPARVCFHIIPDLYSETTIFKLLTEVKTFAPESDILFLGFKTNGRGKEAKPRHIEKMGEIFAYIKENHLAIQCDTKLVQDYLSVIQQVSNRLSYDIREGEFSMNIDCVEKIYTQSSYHLGFKGTIDETFDLAEAFGAVRTYGGYSTFQKEGE